MMFDSSPARLLSKIVKNFTDHLQSWLLAKAQGRSEAENVVDHVSPSRRIPVGDALAQEQFGRRRCWIVLCPFILNQCD
jgi:hypothetical protein